LRCTRTGMWCTVVRVCVVREETMHLTLRQDVDSSQVKIGIEARRAGKVSYKKEEVPNKCDNTNVFQKTQLRCTRTGMWCTVVRVCVVGDETMNRTSQQDVDSSQLKMKMKPEDLARCPTKTTNMSLSIN